MFHTVNDITHPTEAEEEAEQASILIKLWKMHWGITLDQSQKNITLNSEWKQKFPSN